MFLIRRSRLVPLAAAAALSLSACGSDGDEGGDEQQVDLAGEETGAAEPTDEPTDEGPDGDLPDGWTLAETDEFSLGLPPGWFDGRQTLEDDEALAEVAAELEGFTEDELADAIEGSIGDLELLAFKTEDFESGFSTNINVNAEQRGPRDDIEPLTEAIPVELEGVGATSVEVEEVEVNDTPALEVTYELPEVGAKGIQHYILADDTVVIATYTAVEPDPESWQSVVDTIEVAS